jgi:hypothetical protein
MIWNGSNKDIIIKISLNIVISALKKYNFEEIHEI